MDTLTQLLLFLAIPGLLLSLAQRLRSALVPGSKGPVATAAFPGPRQFPLVGRIHDLPRFSLWLKFKEWADEFGPIYQTRAVDQTFLVISDETIAEELLVKRGHIYSGRPQIRSLFNHKEGPAYSALMDRNETWQRQRKWVHAAMAEAHRQRFYGHIESETARLLALHLLAPAQALVHTREYCGRIMARLAWDDAAQGRATGDSADATLHCMSVSGPLTNTVTPLWHLPLWANPWKRHERQREGQQRRWWLANLRLARTRFLRGDLPADTWGYRYFAEVQRAGNATLEQDLDEEIFASCMIGFFALVGVVTLAGPLKFFMMAMALHPTWQARAQAEVDRVCGDRMPVLADFAALPTVRACVKETLRWRSGVPLGVPHQAEQDDVYRGVAIKKGTIVLACEWNLNRVAAKYPDADNYRPERYLEPGWPTYMEPLERFPNLRDKDGASMHTFGWGRRTCLGKDLADDELFVAAAGLLWGLQLAPQTCPVTGKPVPIDSQATNSHVILEPDDFPLSIQARSPARAQQILDNFAAVRHQMRMEQ